VLLIAWRMVTQRFGGARVGELMRAFYMPTRYSSGKTQRAAEQIAADLGVPFKILPIEDAFEREIVATKAMLGAGEEVTAVTLQNIQARIRGGAHVELSNSSGGLFLQTGNMSEKAVGYTTVGGDLEGALSIISNVPKTVVTFSSSTCSARTTSRHPAGPVAPRRPRAGREPGGREGSSCRSRSSTPALPVRRREARPGRHAGRIG